MSVDLYAFLDASNVPTREQWDQSIAELGYPLTLDPDLDLSETQVGYSPCTWKGDISTGFEMNVCRDLSEFGGFPNLDLGSRDLLIWFRTGSDALEGACSSVAALALLQYWDAVVYYDADDIVYTFESLEEETRLMLEVAFKQPD